MMDIPSAHSTVPRRELQIGPSRPVSSSEKPEPTGPQILTEGPQTLPGCQIQKNVKMMLGNQRDEEVLDTSSRALFRTKGFQRLI